MNRRRTSAAAPKAPEAEAAQAESAPPAVEAPAEEEAAAPPETAEQTAKKIVPPWEEPKLTVKDIFGDILEELGGQLPEHARDKDDEDKKTKKDDE